jgi:hypothetical protein
MSRRFQFSLGRLFSMISLFALAFWMLRLAIDGEAFRLVAVIAFPVVAGSATGRLFGRGTAGAIAGVVVLGSVAWLVLIGFMTRILP